MECMECMEQMERIEYRFILKPEEERTEEEKEKYDLFIEKMEELTDEYKEFCYFPGRFLQDVYDSLSFEVQIEEEMDESLIKKIQENLAELQVDWDAIHCYKDGGSNTLCMKSRDNILYKKEVNYSHKKSYVLVEELLTIVKEAENDTDIAEKIKSIVQKENEFENIKPIVDDFFSYSRM